MLEYWNELSMCILSRDNRPPPFSTTETHSNKIKKFNTQSWLKSLHWKIGSSKEKKSYKINSFITQLHMMLTIICGLEIKRLNSFHSRLCRLIFLEPLLHLQPETHRAVLFRLFFSQPTRFSQLRIRTSSTVYHISRLIRIREKRILEQPKC